MNFLLSLLVLTFVLYIFSVQLTAYNRLVLDRYRFRYFAIRDELALMVMNGKIAEDSWEFQSSSGRTKSPYQNSRNHVDHATR